MGLRALNFIILIALGAVPAYAQNQGALFSNENKYQLFSNQYNYQSDLLSDVDVGHIGAVWRARIYGNATELETQSAQVGGIDMYMESKYRLLKNVEALVFLRAKFEAGRSQDFFGDLDPNTGILMREGALNWQPIDILNLKAGVIYQDWMNMPLLTSRQSFPGASARIDWRWNDRFQSSFTSQFLVPTSQTLATRTVSREATPTFTTHTLGSNWKNDSLNLVGNVSLYQYKNLPSYVAFQSQRYGNSLSQINGPNNSSFAFPFQGWFAVLSGEYRVSQLFEPNISFSRIKNQKAPNSFADGQIIGVGSKLHFEKYTYYINYENFFAESDVAPAYYNSWAYGNTNKKGFGIDTWLELKEHNFRIRAQYYKADVLNPDGLQQNQDYFYIGVESGYGRI